MMELLCPAGSPEALRFAVQCGAGAVYLGWGGFNARQNARNFSDEEFAQALVYCHTYGVRVYLTLNTLLSDRELPSALEAARTACRLGADAVLVQDWGLLTLLRAVLPDLPVHASTQMSLFTSGGACEAAADGCARVVIAREVSGEDTAAICKNCPAEIEIFVHGALCMCVSGQCAMSAMLGGRSGNRGRCAQPCRLPYGADSPAASAYPLSLKDSCLADYLLSMEDMGVACLKLEGRMKRPEYVAVVTGVYARLLSQRRKPTARERQALEAAFSRSGFTDGYWLDRRDKDMFGVRPKDAPEPRDLFAAARAACEKDDLRKVPVEFSCAVLPGKPASLTVRDGDGHAVTVTGPVPETARNRPLTADDVTERLKKTGGTPYLCARPAAEVGPGLSLSAAALNGLRRSALSALTAERTAPPKRREIPVPEIPDIDCSAASPGWTVSVASPDQLSPELLALGPERVYVPLESLGDTPLSRYGETEWCAVLPRVWRDRDEPALARMLERAARLGVSGALAGNLGHLPLLRGTGLALYGDYGLNVFNSLSLDYLRRKGLASACLSFELRFAQLRDIRKVLPAEAIVYGRLPLMITDHRLSKKDAGALWDRTGAVFPLLRAFGERTEIENSRVLWLADKPDLRRLGLRFLRLRFTTETAEECVRCLRDYQLGAPPRGPFTRGLYERGVE